MAPTCISIFRIPSLAVTAADIGPRTVHLGGLLRMELHKIRLIAPGSDWESPRQPQHGDVVRVPDAEPGRAGLFVESRSPKQSGSRLAAIKAFDGRVEHLSPGLRKAHARRGGARGPVVAVDIVVARVTLSTSECRVLALRQHIPRWAELTWLDKAELRVASHLVCSARAVAVAGGIGYKSAMAKTISK
jgi:hypothetical protein